MRALASLAAALLLVASGLGRGPGDACADEFIEDPNTRAGFMFGLALGPGAVVGNAGSVDSASNTGGGRQRGAGGALSLRVGTSAGPRLLWIVQIDAVAFLSKADSSIENTHSSATIGGQYYLLDALWLSAGLGSAGLTEKKKDTDTGTQTKAELNSGLGLMLSGGYELVRRGSWVINFETLVGLGVYGDGAVGHIAFRLGANHY